MRLILLICLTMLAFAANSLLTRAGVVAGADPMQFAVLRVAAGAVTLCGLVALRGRNSGGGFQLFALSRVFGAAALVTYLIGFSLAYRILDAGLGALILFGVVQMGLFGYALVRRQPVSLFRWTGMGLAMVGLAWLVWPVSATADGTAVRVDLWGAVLMAVAGLAWAAYTVNGQGARDPLSASAGNFAWAAVAVLPVLVLMPNSAMPLVGALTAIASGAIASGLGYALWFKVLTQIQTTTAGIAQLSVPVIALVLGAVVLGEVPDVRATLAAAVVIAGMGIAIIPNRARA
jgi:drug/metabolite transporter (DMT)-like permease